MYSVFKQFVKHTYYWFAIECNTNHGQWYLSLSIDKTSRPVNRINVNRNTLTKLLQWTTHYFVIICYKQAWLMCILDFWGLYLFLLLLLLLWLIQLWKIICNLCCYTLYCFIIIIVIFWFCIFRKHFSCILHLITVAVVLFAAVICSYKRLIHKDMLPKCILVWNAFTHIVFYYTIIVVVRLMAAVIIVIFTQTLLYVILNDIITIDCITCTFTSTILIITRLFWWRCYLHQQLSLLLAFQFLLHFLLLLLV